MSTISAAVNGLVGRSITLGRLNKCGSATSVRCGGSGGWRASHSANASARGPWRASWRGAHGRPRIDWPHLWCHVSIRGNNRQNVFLTDDGAGFGPVTGCDGPSHLAAALVCIDLNPLRAGIVGDPAEYPWSSARAHLAGRDDLDLLDDWAWSECGLRQGWKETLRAGMNEEQIAVDHREHQSLFLGVYDYDDWRFKRRRRAGSITRFRGVLAAVLMVLG